MTPFAAFLQYVVSGLTTGSVYSLLALGFCLIFNATGIVLFAQGDFVSFGGLLMYSLLVGLGLPVPVAFLGALGGACILGAVLERLCLRPARSRDMTILIFITVAASIVLRGAMKDAWGTLPLALPPLTPDVPIRVLGAVMAPQNLWVMGGTALAIAGLVWFFRATVSGKAMRAMAANPRAALLMGIDVKRLTMASFALSGALGALAGVLITPITSLSYDIGLMLGLKGFAAAVLGGYGSFPGAVVGGLALGLLESLGAGYVSSAYKDAFAFCILILVLFVRPHGFLGAREGRAA